MLQVKPTYKRRRRRSVNSVINERQSGTSEVTPRNEAQAVDDKLDLFNRFFINYLTKLLTNMDKGALTHVI